MSSLIPCLILVLGSVLIGACGRVSASYDQALFACGDLDRAAWSEASALIQISGPDGQPQDASLDATWVSADRVSRLPVSSKGCVLTPGGEGRLKVVSADGRHGLAMVPRPSRDLVQQSLSPLARPQITLSCARSVVRHLPELGITVEWMDIKTDEAWQIESLHLNILRDKNPAARLELSNQTWLQSSYLTLPAALLDDGFYNLSLELTTLAGARIVAESTCPGFQLDTLPPSATHLLKDQVSKGGDPLQLHDVEGTEAVYACLSVPGASTCDDLNSYQRASPLLAAPQAGTYILHSYRQDAAGNRSTRTQETFFRDARGPDVQVQWLNPNLRKDVAWASEPHAVNRFLTTVQDDSASTPLVSPSELEDSLQCRVRVISPLGESRLAAEAICHEGRCVGRSMEDWVPCGGHAAFQLSRASEFTLHGYRIQLEVQATDRVGQIGSHQAAFWLNPTAMESWAMDTSMDLAGVYNQLDLFSDRHGNMLGVTEHFEQTSTGTFAPAVFIRPRGIDTWSSALSIESADPTTKTFEDLSLSPRPMLGLNTRNQDSESLWIFQQAQTDGSLALLEVPLQDWSQTPLPDRLTGVHHRLPGSILRTLQTPTPKLMALTSFRDKQRKPYIALMLQASATRYALLSFDGRSFQLLKTFTVPAAIPQHARQMIADTQGRLVLVLGDRLVLYDVNTRQHAMQDNPGIEILKHDAQGFFGMTRAHELFVIDIQEDASRTSLAILGSRPPELARNYENWNPITHLERRPDGSFWLTGRGVNTTSSLLWAFRPDRDKTWILQNALWGWPHQMEWVDVATFGSDARTWQSFITTPLQYGDSQAGPRRVMRKLVRCTFIDVTEEGAFRNNVSQFPTQSVSLAQDAAGNIWRAQVHTNAQLAVSRLDRPQQVKSASVEDHFPFHYASSLTYAPSGEFLVPASNGDMLGFDQKTGTLHKAFSLGEVPWNQTFFDNAGHLWGIDGDHFGGSLRVRGVDGTRESVLLPEGWVPIKIKPLDARRAFVLARNQDRTQFKSFILNLMTRKAEADWPLAQLQMQIADMVIVDGQRVAMVMIPDALLVTVPQAALPKRWHIRMYEEREGAWVPWDNARQPRWPAWHQAAGGLFFTDFADQESLFYEPNSRSLWLAFRQDFGGYGALARWTAAGSWQVFNPSTEHLKETALQFMVDRDQRLIMATRKQVFYYNPGCGAG